MRMWEFVHKTGAVFASPDYLSGKKLRWADNMRSGENGLIGVSDGNIVTCTERLIMTDTFKEVPEESADTAAKRQFLEDCALRLTDKGHYLLASKLRDPEVIELLLQDDD